MRIGLRPTTMAQGLVFGAASSVSNLAALQSAVVARWAGTNLPECCYDVHHVILWVVEELHVPQRIT